MTARTIVSFGGGPGAVSPRVLERARDAAFLRSLLEDTHRDPHGPIQALLVKAQTQLRTLLRVPEHYHVLFFQGGAHAQFAGVPLNLGVAMAGGGAAPVVVTGAELGAWSRTALAEQERFLGGPGRMQRWVPDLSQLRGGAGEVWEGLQTRAGHVKAGNAYAYTCTNETMAGVQLVTDPGAVTTDIVVDATSDLLSRHMDVAKYGVVFASGGKSLGPPGHCVVLARDDLVHRPVPASAMPVPGIMSWREMAQKRPSTANLYNTPPMLSLGIATLAMQEVVDMGGLDVIEARNKRWSQALYEVIDSSRGFYVNTVPKPFRSRVSVVFRVTDPALEPKLHEDARKRGLVQLHNHPSVGGFRASLYNGMSEEGVERLLEFLREFQKAYGG